MGVLIVKSMSDSSVFLMGVTIVALVSLIVGYLTFNKFKTKRRRDVEWGMRAAANKMVMDDDISPRRLKARIIQTLTQNTSDLNMLNNVMQHILVRIDSDLQNDGLLHGLLVERSIGAVDKPKYEAKLSEYVKNLGTSLNVPLMSRVRGPYGSMYGRMRARTVGNRRAYPSYNITSTGNIELLDEELRRY